MFLYVDTNIGFLFLFEVGGTPVTPVPCWHFIVTPDEWYFNVIEN